MAGASVGYGWPLGGPNSYILAIFQTRRVSSGARCLRGAVVNKPICRDNRRQTAHNKPQRSDTGYRFYTKKIAIFIFQEIPRLSINRLGFYQLLSSNGN